jgi:hypothetical protein
MNGTPCTKPWRLQAPSTRSLLRVFTVGWRIFLNWVRLWPVVAVHLSAGRVGPAIVAARQMLDPSQQRFEDELESLLISACEAWETDDRVNARLSMEKALELASDLRYF